MSLAPHTILVLHPAGLAETVLAIPALRSLRAHLPEAEITIAASWAGADLLRLSNSADDTLPVGRLRGQLILPRSFYRSITALRRLREREFDLVIDLAQNSESKFLLSLVRARTRLDAARASRGLVPTIERILHTLAPKERAMRHAAHVYLQRLEPLGVRPTEAEPRIATDREADSRIDKLLEKNGAEFGDLLIGIHPGAGPHTQRWPADRFTSVASRFIHNFNARAIIIGGPRESGLARSMVKQLPDGRAFALRSPEMSDLASLLARLSLVIANLSGPAHLAAAVGAPVVAITGATGPTPRDLLGRRHLQLRGASVESISEDEVYEAACRLLKTSRAESLSWR